MNKYFTIFFFLFFSTTHIGSHSTPSRVLLVDLNRSRLAKSPRSLENKSSLSNQNLTWKKNPPIFLFWLITRRICNFFLLTCYMKGHCWLKLVYYDVPPIYYLFWTLWEYVLFRYVIEKLQFIFGLPEKKINTYFKKNSKLK